MRTAFGAAVMMKRRARSAPFLRAQKAGRAPAGRPDRFHPLPTPTMNRARATFCLLALYALFFPNRTVSETKTTSDSAPHALQRLVLHDFNREEIKNNLRGYGGTWEKDPQDPNSHVAYVLDPDHQRSTQGSALYLSFRLNPQEATENGFWMNLNGLDATAYDHLSLWVKGDPVQGYASSFKVEFKRPHEGSYEFMEKASYVVEGITDEWQRVVVPLNVMNGITDWTKLEEFVISFHSRRADVHQGAYYIDDIELIETGDPGPHIHDPVIPPRKKAWEQSVGGEAAAKPHLQARLTAWPTTALVPFTSLPETDRAFLMRLARDTWRGLTALTDKEHGLPLDTLRFAKGSTALADARIGDYTNVTNIGLYLLAVAGALDLELINRAEALALIDKVLDSLERMEMFNGFFYNYYDTTTLERTSNFISFVDSAWLTSGLMVTRVTFPERADRCTALIDQGNYGFFYDDVEQLMRHGYYINIDYPSEYHYGCLYTEPRAGSLIAIGKGDVPEAHWFKMIRTFPANYTWQSMEPLDRQAKSVRGHAFEGGYYEWKGYRYIPSWGGSVFEALMPTLVVDEQAWAPHSLGTNNVVHTLVHRAYAIDQLGYPVWGMSPCSRTDVDGYGEFGVPYLGARGYAPGVVTPHAAGLALYTAPKAATANLRRLAEQYDIYGAYGFYDAVNPETGEVAYKYLALDQGMMFIALANHLADGSVQKRFAADPIAQRVLNWIGHERFFE